MQREVGILDQRYYEELGSLEKGIPQCKRYIEQLEEAIGPVKEGYGKALEIGCGISMYAGYLIQKGLDFTGIEPSEWAAGWTENAYFSTVYRTRFEDFHAPHQYDVIVASHSFEHLEDAPLAIHKASSMLAYNGELIIVIPDDSDLYNPDHIWFFSEETLCNALRLAGLHVRDLAIRKYIDRENFLYCRAVRSL